MGLLELLNQPAQDPVRLRERMSGGRQSSNIIDQRWPDWTRPLGPYLDVIIRDLLASRPDKVPPLPPTEPGLFNLKNWRGRGTP